jgi:hypothetical protein
VAYARWRTQFALHAGGLKRAASERSSLRSILKASSGDSNEQSTLAALSGNYQPHSECIHASSHALMVFEAHAILPA